MMTDTNDTAKNPGVLIPWEEHKAELPNIQGDEDIVKKAWEDVDTLGYLYIWFCLTGF